jgi:hypothetical protein
VRHTIRLSVGRSIVPCILLRSTGISGTIPATVYPRSTLREAMNATYPPTLRAIFFGQALIKPDPRALHPAQFRALAAHLTRMSALPTRFSTVRILQR